jgi:peptidyl-prolyl cis-trans isomerase SurA
MRSTRALIFLLPLLLTLPLLADSVIEEIVARVNNEIITRAELQRSREQLINEVKEKSGDAEKELPEREKNLLRDMIDQDLLVQKGKEMGITADTELIKRLDEMRKQMNLGSMEELETAAQQQGVSFEDFKQNIRNQIITQEVISREVGSKMPIPPEEIKAFYDAHQKELEQPEAVRLSEILVSTQPKGAAETKNAPAPSPEMVTAAEQRAHELLDSIHKGASFEDVAKKSSDGPTAAQAGDLGYFKRNTLAKELEDVTFAMKAGQISDVIRTKQGFIILKVTEHHLAGMPPMKEVEDQIREAIYLDKLQPALRAYLTKLREDAYLDIKPGFVDTGASPNQTKPVFTASASPGPEKKKKKKKLGVF